MSSEDAARPGTIGWVDLTVDDAARVRSFYEDVVGWRPAAVDMGEYEDWAMEAGEGGAAVAGVCHKRGTNASLPSCWLIYVTVADLDRSLEQCVRRGGSIVSDPRSAGGGTYAVIRDPAGAALALFQPAS